MYKMNFILAILVTCFHFHFVNVIGQSVADVKNLKQLLFTTNTYDKHIRPVNNQSSVTNIFLDYYMAGLNGLDPVAQKFSTTGYLYVTWKDSELSWTPASYGGLQTLYVSQDMIWKPDLALKNGFSSLSELGSTFLHVKIDYQGNIEWLPYQVFESKCPVDIRHYPFDTQECSLEFVSWSTDMNEVQLVSGNIGLELSDFDPSTEWDLVDLSTSYEQEPNQRTLLFNIKMNRKPMFFVLNQLLPIFLLAFLGIITFVLPGDCGEKISYSITVFLAFAVFLTIVSASLPANSTTISLVSGYLIFHLCQGTFIIVLAGIQIRIMGWDGAKRIPGCLQSLARHTRRVRCRIRTTVTTITTSDNKSEIDKIDKRYSTTHQNMTTGELIEHSNKRNDQQNRTTVHKNNFVDVKADDLKESIENQEVTWREVSMALDVVYFCTFFMLLIISTSVLIGIGNIPR